MPNSSPKIRSTPAKHPLLGEHLWGTASVERNLKGLTYKKVIKSYYLQWLKEIY